MKELFVTLSAIATPFLFALVGWFIKKVLDSNEKQHEEMNNNIKEVEQETKNQLSNISKEINTELKEQRKKLNQVEESTLRVEAKQERLDIFGMKIDEIQKTVENQIEEQEEFVDDLEEKIQQNKNELKELKENFNAKVPLPDIDKYMNTEYLSELEKKGIKEHLEYLQNAPLQGYKIAGFLHFLDEKIKKRELEMHSFSEKNKISVELLQELQAKPSRRSGQ